MSDFDGFNEHHKRHKERHEERREARHDRRDHGDHDNYGSQQYGQGYRRDDDDDDERRRPQFQDQERGYGPPSGPQPPSGFASQGRFDRGDFASDADVDRMITSGEFNQRQGREHGGYGRGYGDGERGNAHGQYDAPSGPPSGQGYGERTNEYGRHDAPSGPPPGRGYQSEQPHRQGFESGGGYGSSYGGGSDRQNQYGSPQTQGRTQYEAPQGFPSSHGRGQGNAPPGGFTASRDGEERFGSGYGGSLGDRTESSRRGEAASYYNQQGASGDRYAHLSTMAQEHGDDDPELYRRATQGLHERIETQAHDDDYKTHVDAHRKAYGGNDHGPMDSDSIGAAAAMEAFKQTVGTGGSSNAPAGAFRASNVSGGISSKPGRAEEEEAGATAARAGDSRGMQDKLMALAMSHAGKLFDKKNAGSSGGGAKPEDKAQAMQSAAAGAMQLFTKYQSSGKLDASDMSSVMALATKLF